MLQTKNKNDLCCKGFKKRIQGLTSRRLSSLEPALTQGPSWAEYAPIEACRFNDMNLAESCCCYPQGTSSNVIAVPIASVKGEIMALLNGLVLFALEIMLMCDLFAAHGKADVSSSSCFIH